MSSANLYQLRAPLRNEIENNPQLKLRLAALITLENPAAGTAVAESLFNRSIYSDQSIAQAIGGGSNSFYGPVRRGEVDARMRELANDPSRLQAVYNQINQAYSSNFVQGNTDQGSKGDPNYDKGGVGVNFHGERFNDWGGGPGGNSGAKAWREDLMRVASDDTGGDTMLPSRALRLQFPTGGTQAIPYTPQGVSLTSTPGATAAPVGWQGGVSTANPGTNTPPPMNPAVNSDGTANTDSSGSSAATASGGGGLQGLLGNNNAMSGLGDIAKGLDPRPKPGNDQNSIAAAPMNFGGASGGAQAAQLMQALLQSRRNPYGLQLNGIPMGSGMGM